MGIRARYLTVDIRSEQLPDAWEQLRDSEFEGINLTSPLKETVIPLLDELSPEAQQIGAVNTVYRVGARWIGYNTDVYGFTEQLRPYADRLTNGIVLVLGAGGAAAAVVWSLLNAARVTRIIIANRIPGRARQLARRLAVLNPSAEMADRSLDTVDDLPYALAVNVTSAFQTEPPDAALAAILQKCPLLIDLNYRPKRTAFMNCGSAVAVNGLEMLLYQAARSFQLWTGVDMPLGPIRQVLQAE